MSQVSDQELVIQSLPVELIHRVMLMLMLLYGKEHME